MKEYSEALIRKLEEKNSELERAGEQLLKASQVHSAQARELERAREELQNQNAELEMRVRERTSQLEAANRELETFSHSAAHDMRAPLRAIVGYSGMLLEGETARLSSDGVRYLEAITASVRQMNDLIDDLLKLSRISRCDLVRQPVELSGLARGIVAELQRAEPERQVETVIAPDIMVDGDEALLRIALENLLNNAWKFTSKTERARIEFVLKQDAVTRTCIVARQRCRLRHGLRRQVISTVSAVALAVRVSRHWRRAGDRGAHHPSTRRPYLGGKRSRWPNQLLFHPLNLGPPQPRHMEVLIVDLVKTYSQQVVAEFVRKHTLIIVISWSC